MLDPDAATTAELSWPPWLENLTDQQRIRAIVSAVAECARTHHGIAMPASQHCTEAMAEHFLDKIAAEAAARECQRIRQGSRLCNNGTEYSVPADLLDGDGDG